MKAKSEKYEAIFREVGRLGDEDSHILVEDSESATITVRVSEYEEIDELRRLSAELSDPPRRLYTTT